MADKKVDQKHIKAYGGILSEDELTVAAAEAGQMEQIASEFPISFLKKYPNGVRRTIGRLPLAVAQAQITGLSKREVKERD